MAGTIFKYPLDLLGTSPTNKVTNEVHTIGALRGRLFAADYGPFFGSTAIIKDVVSGKVLVPVTDYVLVHHYREASLATGQSVYTAVRIINPTVGTQVSISAQMVGGEFSYSLYAILQAIEDLTDDNRVIAWGDIIGIPSQFVPTPHLHSAYDLYGLKYLIESNYDIAAAIREGDTASRQLLLDQIRAKFADYDAFCLGIANEFDIAASELALL
jgi:hypothetical protein